MYSLSLLSLLLLSTTSKASQFACAPVHLIVARASLEPPGYGIIGSLSRELQSRVPGTTSEAIAYPATLSDYGNSIAEGTAAVINRVTSYAQSCPSSKIVLLGYSQGAAIIGDALCGGGGGKEHWPMTPPLEGKIGDHITAIVQMGDPRFVPGLAWDAGSAVTGGLYARDPSTQKCDKYVGRMISWCDASDARCDSGNSLAVHMTYLKRYKQKAVDFVLARLKVV
jgi:acetylxylan esterase